MPKKWVVGGETSWDSPRDSHLERDVRCTDCPEREGSEECAGVSSWKGLGPAATCMS